MRRKFPPGLHRHQRQAPSERQASVAEGELLFAPMLRQTPGPQAGFAAAGSQEMQICISSRRSPYRSPARQALSTAFPCPASQNCPKTTLPALPVASMDQHSWLRTAKTGLEGALGSHLGLNPALGPLRPKQPDLGKNESFSHCCPAYSPAIPDVRTDCMAGIHTEFGLACHAPCSLCRAPVRVAPPFLCRKARFSAPPGQLYRSCQRGLVMVDRQASPCFAQAPHRRATADRRSQISLGQFQSPTIGVGKSPRRAMLAAGVRFKVTFNVPMASAGSISPVRDARTSARRPPRVPVKRPKSGCHISPRCVPRSSAGAPGDVRPHPHSRLDEPRFEARRRGLAQPRQRVSRRGFGGGDRFWRPCAEEARRRVDGAVRLSACAGERRGARCARRARDPTRAGRNQRQKREQGRRRSFPRGSALSSAGGGRRDGRGVRRRAERRGAARPSCC